MKHYKALKVVKTYIITVIFKVGDYLIFDGFPLSF